MTRFGFWTEFGWEKFLHTREADVVARAEYGGPPHTNNEDTFARSRPFHFQNYMNIICERD